MQDKIFTPVCLLIVILLIVVFSGTPQVVATQETASQTFGAAPTYSEVVKTYPKDSAICATNAELLNVDANTALISGTIEATGGEFSLKVESGSMQIVGVGKSGGFIYKSSSNGSFRVGRIADKKGNPVGSFCFQCYGTKIIVNKRVTLDGKTYEPGTKMTVDKDLQWIVISSWD